jgi:hypothetical protein
MLDLECKRDEAVSEYQLALANRDGQQDTRIAAERGIKTAYPRKDKGCDDDADDDADPKAPDAAKPAPNTGASAPPVAPKPQ